VVNLNRRKDRLQTFTASVCDREPWLARRTCRLAAADGKELQKDAAWQARLVGEGYVKNATLQAALSQSGGAVTWGDLSPGAIALYVSHSQAWKQILAKNWDFGLVMEDDLQFYSADFESLFQQVLRDAKEGWGVVQLQSCDAQDCDVQHRKNCWEKGKPQRVSPDSVSRLVKLPPHQHLACTGAYIVSRRGAEALLANDFPINKQLDIAISADAMKGMPVLKAIPPVAQCNEQRKGSGAYDSDVQYPGDGKKLRGHVSELLRSVRAFGLLDVNESPGQKLGTRSVCSVVPPKQNRASGEIIGPGGVVGLPEC